MGGQPRYPLGEISRAIGGTVMGDAHVVITGVNSLEAAGPGDISYFSDRRYRKGLEKTKATAIIAREVSPVFKGPQILSPDPALAFARAAGLFAGRVPAFRGTSEQACVQGSSRLGRNVSIYPMVYVGEDAVIGDDTVLFPGVFIGDRVKIGARTILLPNVAILQDCVVGSDVVIHAGTVIGSDGFGYARDGAVSVKIPQMGYVQIDDDVEIGANNCIDRAAFGKTWLMRGVKTDNLVHVAHNVVIGENTIVLAQAAFSGSVSVGSGVIVGGQVGVADHLTIGDGAMIAGRSGLAKSVGPGEVVSGSPAIPHKTWLKSSSLVARLPEMNDRLRQVERRLAELDRRLGKE
jgi:UDP-3-O-[3-hydroxymyristoyl] glucosamine N-acyltransferase